MFHQGREHAWSVGRWATAVIAVLLVFLGAMLALWGISLAVEGGPGAGLTLAILGVVLAFTGSALARGPWGANHARPARHHVRG